MFFPISTIPFTAWGGEENIYKIFISLILSNLVIDSNLQFTKIVKLIETKRIRFFT